MTNRERETQARINIQRSLKAVAQAIKAENFSVSRELAKRISVKTGRDKMCLAISGIIDEFCHGRLVSKEQIPSPHKSSKQKLLRWTYLERNDDHPFEYFENQLFTIGELFMNSKNPLNTKQRDSYIRITRHCLERVAERFDKSTLSDVLNVVAIYASSIGLFKEKCIKSIEDNQFILLSESAYIVVKTKYNKQDDTNTYAGEGYEFIITTIIPRSIWSKRRQALLQNAIEAIEKYNAKSTEELKVLAIMTIKPSGINNDNLSSAAFNDDNFIFWEAA